MRLLVLLRSDVDILTVLGQARSNVLGKLLINVL